MVILSPIIAAALAAALTVYIPFAALCFAIVIIILAATAGVLYFFRLLRPVYLYATLAAAAGIVIGLWSISRIDHFAPGLPVEKISSLSGILLDDPRSFAGHGQSILPDTEQGMALIQIKQAGASGTVRTSARGRVLVFFPAGTMPRLREFGRGAEVYIEGNFLPEDFSPGLGTIPRFRSNSVHIVQSAPLLEQRRSTVRSSILSRLQPKNWGGLAAALLMGSRENLDGSLADSFRNAGLSYLLALSGMHLAFLSAMLAFILKKPLGKHKAIYSGMVFIFLYVFLVGPQPSLVRSLIMYVTGSLLILSGTKRQPFAVLGAAFLVQILWDPVSVYSISFILSYAALFGIFAVSGKIETLLRGYIPDLFAKGFGLSAGAFLASAPFVIAFFGILRPAGLIIGIFAAPLIGLFMALSLAWLVLGQVPVLGMILDILLGALQYIIHQIILLFSGIPGISAGLPLTLIVTVIIIAGLFVLSQSQNRHRNYLAPFV